MICRVGLTIWLLSSLVFGQADASFSIRAESHQVLLLAQVFHNRLDQSGKATEKYWSCMKANREQFVNLPMSQASITEKDCIAEVEVLDLKPEEFHLFEDGVEQKITRVVLERSPWTVERDVHRHFAEHHKIWSHTPRGIWRSPDLESSWMHSATYAYRIAYAPPKLERGSCHRVKVKVDRPHIEVVATDRYCYIEHPSTDPLLGTDFGKQMENELTSDKRPKIPLAAEAGFFCADGGTARVEIVLEFPWYQLHRHRDWGWFTVANIGVLGAAYRSDGVIAARFSDSAIQRGNLHWGGEPSERAALPSRYETQMDLPPQDYMLSILLSDGSKFGRAAVPLRVGDCNNKELAISSIFLFKRLRFADVAAQEAKKVNLAPDYLPLVSGDKEVTPTAKPTFAPKQTIPAYFEVYSPTPGETAGAAAQARMRIVDPVTGAVIVDFPWFDLAPYRRPGTNKFAVMKYLHFDQLTSGKYQLEAQARDSNGKTTAWRGARFQLSPRGGKKRLETLSGVR